MYQFSGSILSQQEILCIIWEKIYSGNRVVDTKKVREVWLTKLQIDSIKSAGKRYVAVPTEQKRERDE